MAILVFFGNIWIYLFVNWKAFQGRRSLTTQETLVRALGKVSLLRHRYAELQKDEGHMDLWFWLTN